MTARIQIFDSNSIEHLQWPADELAQRAKAYLVPLIKSSPQNFIPNANVQMMIVTIDSSILPLLVSPDRLGNSDVCSPYSHFVDYTLEELSKRESGLSRAASKTLVRGAATVLQLSHVDKAVYVNNWLFTTNPCPDLSSAQIADLTSHLLERFPDHAILFPSVTPVLHEGLFAALQQNGFTMIPSRIVYLFDPSNSLPTIHSNLVRDAALLKNSPYQVIGDNDITEDDIPRITELYQKLYLKKYTLLNLQLNEAYFSLMLRGRTFTTRVLKRDNRIDAFICWHNTGGFMTASLIGYDTDLPVELGLYRKAFAIVITAASDQGKILHLSGGAGSFKMLRGCTPHVEYISVYARHLPFYRRLGWYCAWAGGIFQHAQVQRLTGKSMRADGAPTNRSRIRSPRR
jgi:hypothetical protein